jgi:hypothetical protein
MVFIELVKMELSGYLQQAIKRSNSLSLKTRPSLMSKALWDIPHITRFMMLESKSL